MITDHDYAYFVQQIMSFNPEVTEIKLPTLRHLRKQLAALSLEQYEEEKKHPVQPPPEPDQTDLFTIEELLAVVPSSQQPDDDRDLYYETEVVTVRQLLPDGTLGPPMEVEKKVQVDLSDQLIKPGPRYQEHIFTRPKHDANFSELRPNSLNPDPKHFYKFQYLAQSEPKPDVETDKFEDYLRTKPNLTQADLDHLNARRRHASTLNLVPGDRAAKLERSKRIIESLPMEIRELNVSDLPSSTRNSSDTSSGWQQVSQPPSPTNSSSSKSLRSKSASAH